MPWARGLHVGTATTRVHPAALVARRAIAPLCRRWADGCILAGWLATKPALARSLDRWVGRSPPGSLAGEVPGCTREFAVAYLTLAPSPPHPPTPHSPLKMVRAPAPPTTTTMHGTDAHSSRAPPPVAPPARSTGPRSTRASALTRVSFRNVSDSASACIHGSAMQ